MKIIYLIHTHKDLEQIYRLVKIIKSSSPESYIIVIHNFKYSILDVEFLESLPKVKILKSSERKLGSFSLVQEYLDVLDWVFSQNIEFDWLINLTGQDYPTQPLPQIEKFLAETEFDGFLEYFDALSDFEQNTWKRGEGFDRYLYSYWWFYGYLQRWQRAFLKLPREIINSIQPFIRIKTQYSLMVGIRSTNLPFNDSFLCYAGSYFHTLSQNCIQYLYEFAQKNPDLVNYYKKTYLPDESFIQAILVNSKLFNLCNDNKRYMDYRKGLPYDGCRKLSSEDYPILCKDDIHFARKFDIKYDSKILDMLDARLSLIHI